MSEDEVVVDVAVISDPFTDLKVPSNKVVIVIEKVDVATDRGPVPSESMGDVSWDGAIWW